MAQTSTEHKDRAYKFELEHIPISKFIKKKEGKRGWNSRAHFDVFRRCVYVTLRSAAQTGFLLMPQFIHLRTYLYIQAVPTKYRLHVLPGMYCVSDTSLIISVDKHGDDDDAYHGDANTCKLPARTIATAHNHIRASFFFFLCPWKMST